MIESRILFMLYNLKLKESLMLDAFADAVRLPELYLEKSEIIKITKSAPHLEKSLLRMKTTYEPMLKSIAETKNLMNRYEEFLNSSFKDSHLSVRPKVFQAWGEMRWFFEDIAVRIRKIVALITSDPRLMRFHNINRTGGTESLRNQVKQAAGKLFFEALEEGRTIAEEYKLFQSLSDQLIPAVLGIISGQIKEINLYSEEDLLKQVIEFNEDDREFANAGLKRYSEGLKKIDEEG
jgi:hypothetical protein